MDFSSCVSWSFNAQMYPIMQTNERQETHCPVEQSGM